MTHSIETYRDLLAVLESLPSAQLDQPIQTVLGLADETKVARADPVIAIGTVDDLGLLYVRSSRDNRRHGEDIILYCDKNPYDERASMGRYMGPEGRHEPIYPTGHGPDQDWTGPAQALVDATVIHTPDGRITSSDQGPAIASPRPGSGESEGT